MTSSVDVYRLGGDASAGISSLVTVRFPGYGAGGDGVVFTIDIAISLTELLRLGDAARLLRDGLVLVTADLPSAVGDILPLDVDVQLAEVYLLAATMDGNGANRPNQLLNRVDLSQLGSPTRDLGQQLGFAARIPAALTEREAASVVVDAFEYMALASGYLDPTIGISVLRGELGLPPST